jgi:hypothetical protein
MTWDADGTLDADGALDADGTQDAGETRPLSAPTSSIASWFNRFIESVQ